jgi:hypothetical protein
VGDVENFCWHVLHTNCEMRGRDVGRLLWDHRAELLKAALKAEKRGCISMDGDGEEETE